MDNIYVPLQPADKYPLPYLLLWTICKLIKAQHSMMATPLSLSNLVIGGYTGGSTGIGAINFYNYIITYRKMLIDNLRILVNNSF